MSKPADFSHLDDLFTIRDWLRYAVSRFTVAKLAYGHGTETALDEAAYLILSALSLPIDQLEPWMDARLTRDERAKVADLIQQRIATRKPAAYLVNTAWIRGRPFYVDERVIVPRSYIGELLDDGLSAVVPDPDGVESILDLCTGSGCLAILAALTYPNAAVDAVDISVGALEVAARNVEDYGLTDRISIHRSDLFAGLEGRTYDLIISNPPYVTAEAVAAFPPEYKAEPELAHLGGDDGLDLVRRILAEAAVHLNTEGMLVVEVGMAREALETEYPSLPFLWLDTEQSEGELFALTAEALKRHA
ncbi:50S ribosomal protein L3 N(5)-glutamine methyltransferase [Hyphomicrobium sp.]|uniref:50S ribosomal protein L3 N(5)-glutamine methyltransferase n=1 Tax=Hyphomicrobium sp. TaxID=82 RepID=UPI003F6F2D7D